MEATHIVIQRHKFGYSFALIHLDEDPMELTNAQEIQIAEQCGLDYDPEEDEDLDFISIEQEKVVEIKL